MWIGNLPLLQQGPNNKKTFHEKKPRFLKQWKGFSSDSRELVLHLFTFKTFKTFWRSLSYVFTVQPRFWQVCPWLLRGGDKPEIFWPRVDGPLNSTSKNTSTFHPFSFTYRWSKSTIKVCARSHLWPACPTASRL